MLLLNIDRKSYMGSPMALSNLTLCDLERSKSRSLGFWVVADLCSIIYTYICLWLISALIWMSQKNLLAAGFSAVPAVFLLFHFTKTGMQSCMNFFFLLRLWFFLTYKVFELVKQLICWCLLSMVIPERAVWEMFFFSCTFDVWLKWAKQRGRWAGRWSSPHSSFELRKHTRTASHSPNVQGRTTGSRKRTHPTLPPHDRDLEGWVQCSWRIYCRRATWQEVGVYVCRYMQPKLYYQCG